jgi:peptidyl-prolyl cis-trans isomerase C
MLVEQKVGTYLMAEQARKAGLDKTREFIEKVEASKEDLLIKTFMTRELAPKVDNEQVLKNRYEKYKSEFKKTKEHQVYHIMLPSEEEAKRVLEALAKGEDFAKLAKEKSIAPSKTKGGEEGYVPLDILPPDMKDKLKALKPNEYTKEFLKTEAGCHIFKIGDSRDSSPKSYDELKEGLKHLVMQDEYMKMVERLSKQYNVERFNDDGTPIAKTDAAAVSTSEPAAAPVK